MTSFWPQRHPVAQYGELLEVKKMHKLDIVTLGGGGGGSKNICCFVILSGGWVICFVLVSLDLGEGETLVELLFLFFFVTRQGLGRGVW